MNAIRAESFFSSEPPPFIPVDPGNPDIRALNERAESIDSATYPLDAVKAILKTQNSAIGAGSAAHTAINAIDNKTLFVICGQQAGLFGGPLYILYKVMHAVRLSAVLAEHTVKHVVPLFWIASDDHDFEEVSSLGIRTGDGTLQRIEYTPAMYREGMPVGDIVIDSGIDDAVGMLKKHIVPGDFSDRYMDIVSSSWQPGVTWTAAFAKQYAALFSEQCLVMFDPRGEGAKELFTGIMTAEIENPSASSNLVNTEANSYETSRERKRAIRKPEGSTNLFFESDGIRHALFFDENRFIAGGRYFSKKEMHRLLDAEPGRFSPGAALRPVCQDAVFPSAAFIAGPGERFYLEQIAPVYDLFNVSRPIVWPRASFTVIDAKTKRISEKEGIPLEKLFLDPDSIRNEHARLTFPEDIKQRFDTLERTIDSELDEIAERIGDIDATLTDSVRKEKGKMLHTLNGIHDRAVRAHKSKTELSEKRYHTSSYFLSPDGGPQERWFGIDAIAPLLRDRGFDELLELTSPDEGYHRIILPGIE